MHTVLIVDDEEAFRHIVHVILKRAGYHTLLAENGVDALRMVAEHQPDIIILDEMMPELSGGEVCMELKSNPATRHIPVIMHSAGLKILDPSYIAQIGANGAIAKPCLPAEMVEYVGRFLKARV